MAPNQKDVAREAGVSTATVSRVLNDDPAVIEPTKEKVRAAMRRLNYTPNAAARQLSLNRSDTIGIVITQVASGFFASVMYGISVAAQYEGYTTTFTVATMEDRGRLIYRKLLEEQRVDGLVILEPWLDERQVAELETLKGPVVLVQREASGTKIGSVCVDNRGGAYAGMKHLLDAGHTDILVVRGPKATFDARDREEGCKAAASEAGKDAQVRMIDGFFHPERAVEAFRAFRDKNGLPRAVFALNDAMAIAILKDLRREGVKVPESVAVMGFDGIEAADLFDLTTVVTPMTDLGQKAVELVCERLEKPDTPARHLKLDGRLVVRATA